MPLPVDVIARIREEESLRIQLREELGKTDTPPKKTNGLWLFLNSEFGKWIIPAFATALVPILWALIDPFGIVAAKTQKEEDTVKELKQEKAALRQREDSQFLTQLLPILAGNDQRAIRRAIYIVQARYPKGEIPDGVRQLLEAVVLDLNEAPQLQQLASNVLAGERITRVPSTKSTGRGSGTNSQSKKGGSRAGGPATTSATNSPPEPATGTPTQPPTATTDALPREEPAPEPEVTLYWAGITPGTTIHLRPVYPGDNIDLELYDDHPSYLLGRFGNKTVDLLNPGALRVLDTHVTKSGYKWIKISTAYKGKQEIGWFSWGTREYSTIKVN